MYRARQIDGINVVIAIIVVAIIIVIFIYLFKITNPDVKPAPLLPVQPSLDPNIPSTPVVPVQPVQPVAPVWPPVQPVTPVTPVRPPVQPVTPIQPVVPVRPPVQPVQPVQPVKPPNPSSNAIDVLNKNCSQMLPSIKPECNYDSKYKFFVFKSVDNSTKPMSVQSLPMKTASAMQMCQVKCAKNKACGGFLYDGTECRFYSGTRNDILKNSFKDTSKRRKQLFVK